MTAYRHSTTGFTLVEMSMVLIIIGLVMLAVFPALMALRTGSQRSVTQANLHALLTATAAYVQANGCLPCPTPAGTIGAGFGRVAGLTTNTACAACTGTPEGIPPFAALGLPASMAHDGWGHWMTMRVDPALTAPNLASVVPPTKPVACACSVPTGTTCAPTPANCTCAAAVNGICTPLPAGLSQQGFCAASGTGTGQLSKTNSISVQTPGGATQSAAVIFVSHGEKGFGSFIAGPKQIGTNILNGSPVPFPAAYASCSGGGYAACNSAATNSTTFYDAPQVATGSAIYDDMLAYADRNTLVSMFGNGSCQTVW